MDRRHSSPFLKLVVSVCSLNALFDVVRFVAFVASWSVPSPLDVKYSYKISRRACWSFQSTSMSEFNAFAVSSALTGIAKNCTGYSCQKRSLQKSATLRHQVARIIILLLFFGGDFPHSRIRSSTLSVLHFRYNPYTWMAIWSAENSVVASAFGRDSGLETWSERQAYTTVTYYAIIHICVQTSTLCYIYIVR